MTSFTPTAAMLIRWTREKARSWPASLAPRRAATILGIDDDNDVRAFLADSLKELGYAVVEAASGEEGIGKVAAATPDLLLLDFAMPGMHGADVARALRKTHPGLPIVFVTGYAETDEIERALGTDGPVLRKPFSMDQLAAVVAAQLPAIASLSLRSA